MNRCRKCGKVGCEIYYTNSRIFGQVPMSECCQYKVDSVASMMPQLGKGEELTVEDIERLTGRKLIPIAESFVKRPRSEPREVPA